MSHSKSSHMSGSAPRPQRGSSIRSPTPNGPSPSSDELTVISNRAPITDFPDTRKMQPLEVGRMLEGERLGQFILTEFVGGGGMGAVFRALDTTLNRDVAVKVLSRDQSEDEETLRRFKNEAQSAARLDHDNIARVHYVGEDRGVHYIVFEFIEGVNLRDLVDERGPLPLSEAVSYVLQVAEALSHASQRDVIHRDIKPSNVLITPDGKAKLVDMGLARLHQVEHPDNDLTQSGVTLGTFDYISPEQARDPRSADVRSDLYSLGCSFYYTLTGRPPFPDGTVLQKLLQHQADEPPDPRDFRDDLPDGLTRILTKMLAKNPAKRYQQPADLIADLLVLAQQLGFSAATPAGLFKTSTRLAPPSAWQRHAPWVAPLAALVIIVVGLDFHWSRNRGQSAGPVLPAIKPPAQSANSTSSPPAGVAKSSGQPATNRSAAPGDRESIASPAANGSNSSDSTPAAAAIPDSTALASLGSEPTQASLSSPPLSAELRFDRLAAGAWSLIETAGQAMNIASKAGDSGSKPRDGSGSRGAERDGVLVVSDTPGPHNYASLRAACSAAKNGDVIELRYSGRREEEPFSLANLKLKIRAGERCQPTVLFRPQEDPVKYPRSMITVAGGQLTLSNVNLELDTPRNFAADHWTLIELQLADLVRLERCWLTIANANDAREAAHKSVAFFDVKGAPGSETMMKDPAGFVEHLVDIQLQNCVARGEAFLLRTGDLQPVKLQWDNGLLVTSERLLWASGASMAAHPTGQTQIDLEHVTAIVRNGFALLDSSEAAPHDLPVEFNCGDSILAGAADAPLIEQRAVSRGDDFRGRVRWNGDRMFYEGFDVFWKSQDMANLGNNQQLLFSDWQSYWGDSREILPYRGAVVWRARPTSDHPVHLQTVGDYLLDSTAPNSPALGGASDGLDTGFRAELLPPMPSE